MTGSIAEAATVLYGGPLDAFVARRDALAKEVRAGGDRELAAAIKALRKPTVVADALNRTVRADPDAVERLLAAVDRLRRTQEAMLAGEPADFGADQTAYRAAIEAVAGNAPSHDVEVRSAIETAAVGDLAAELLAGTFSVPPEPVGGFGPFAAGSGSMAADRPHPSRAGSPPGPSGSSAGERGPSAAERRMAERARRAAEQALDLAEAEHRAAGQAAAAAVDRLAVLDGELADLSERLEAARRARDDALVVRAEADARLGAATGRLDEATSAVEGL